MTDNCNNRWIFGENKLINSPSRSDSIGINEELLLRQKGTNFIKEISDLLKLKPICMNTAIVYFHRFFIIRSLKHFNIYQISVCCLFIASKFEEQPIFKEHIIKVSHLCQNRDKNKVIKDEEYKKECDKLIENENEMLLTLGFDLSVRHPHSVIINASQISVINKDICQKAYKIANDLLRQSMICLQYNPTFIACVCIYISNHFSKIPITATNNINNKNITNNWCQLIDPNISLEDVEKVALNYKQYINISKHSNVLQKKRMLSFDDNYSPESAYSSGSGNSPIYESLANQKIVSSSKTLNGNANDLNSEKIPNKRFRSEQNHSLSHSSLKSKSLSSKMSSINTIPNSKIVSNNLKSVPKDGNSVRNTNSLIGLTKTDLTFGKTGLTSKVRKLITNEEDIYDNFKNNTNNKQNLPKTGENVFSSSTETLKPLNNSKLGKKCLMKPKNFTITFSNDSFLNKTNDTSKSVNNIRIVRETGNNSCKQTVKIET